MPIPSTLARPGPFWSAVALTGIGTGVAAVALTRVLEIVQGLMWRISGADLLDAARQAGAWRHILVLLGTGILTGAGQIILRRLSSGNGIDTTAAIWFHAVRLPAWRTLGSALLSVVIVGMGAALGREGAPKQAGAVLASFFSDKARLSEEQRRLLVACGAGAGWPLPMGTIGRRAVRTRSDARSAGAQICFARPVRVGGCDRSVVAGFARRANLSHPGLCQLRFECSVGARGWADCRCGFGRLCSGSHLGRPQ
jgi:hypothetical protein